MPPPSPAAVLIVDDERAIRRFLRSTLEAQGYAALEAATGAEGLRAVRHHRPALILLDLGLPDRDGLALIPEIRALTDAPLLVLTVRDAEASKVHACPAGVVGCWTKRCGAWELLAGLGAAVRHGVQAQAGRPRIEAGSRAIDFVSRRVAREGAEIRF